MLSDSNYKKFSIFNFQFSVEGITNKYKKTIVNFIIKHEKIFKQFKLKYYNNKKPDQLSCTNLFKIENY
jgi:hypothetical protein